MYIFGMKNVRLAWINCVVFSMNCIDQGWELTEPKRGIVVGVVCPVRWTYTLSSSSPPPPLQPVDIFFKVHPGAFFSLIVRKKFKAETMVCKTYKPHAG